jgi:hypothetical protein
LNSAEPISRLELETCGLRNRRYGTPNARKMGNSWGEEFAVLGGLDAHPKAVHDLE